MIGDDVMVVAAGSRVGAIPPQVAARAAEVIAAGPPPDVAVEALEQILDEADAAITRLQIGESVRGTAALARIKNLARDGLRWAGAA